MLCVKPSRARRRFYANTNRQTVPFLYFRTSCRTASTYLMSRPTNDYRLEGWLRDPKRCKLVVTAAKRETQPQDSRSKCKGYKPIWRRGANSPATLSRSRFCFNHPSNDDIDHMSQYRVENSYTANVLPRLQNLIYDDAVKIYFSLRDG